MYKLASDMTHDRVKLSEEDNEILKSKNDQLIK